MSRKMLRRLFQITAAGTIPVQFDDRGHGIRGDPAFLRLHPHPAQHFRQGILDEAQLRKYLESDELDAVIVVTQRVTRVPNAIDGKPVRLLSLNRLWGVALP